MPEKPNPLSFTSRSAWRAWLKKNHASAREAWLVHSKKGSGHPGLAYEEAVEEALCYGWIDGQLRSRDGETFILRYSPRRASSVWAVSNQQRVKRLLREGKMTEAGMQKVREAQASGEWQAARRRERPDWIPEDLARGLRRRKGALAAFRCLPTSRKQQLVWWVESAKRDETRQKRLRAILAEIEDNLRV
jgi:uncharacterized protein YdeI (YjbR/CyaY-like superfamily)